MSDSGLLDRPSVSPAVPEFRPLRVYLAARYSRRLELCQYRDELRAAGVEVTSRWLDGTHQISDDGKPIDDFGEHLADGDDGSESGHAANLRERFAHEDLIDIRRADCLVAFTEPPRTGATRGGRHVELGYALGQQKMIAIVGHRENIFCWSKYVSFYPTWEACSRDFIPWMEGWYSRDRQTTEAIAVSADDRV